MKKTLILSLLFIILLSGCSKQDNHISAEQTNNAPEVNNNFRRPGMLDFEKPEEEPGLRGLVKAVLGNEVTILELAIPDRDRVKDDQTTENNDEENSQAPTATFGSEGGMKPGGGMGGGDRAKVNEDNRLEMIKNITTGEAKVTIPVGIKMLKNEEGGMVEATLLDVTANKMLMIWLNKDIEGRNVADFVIIN